MSSAFLLRQVVSTLQSNQHSQQLHACITCIGLAGRGLRRPLGTLRLASYSQVLCTQRLLKLTASAGEPPQATRSASPEEDAQIDQFLPAIVLAYFASQNRSLLAADCLIETVVEMYRRGMQLDSLQFALSMATLQSGSTLLSEQELDILTARCGIVMLTLHEVGCAVYPKAHGASGTVQNQQQEESLNEQSKRLTRGLGRFVKQIVDMYKSGFDSKRMLLQQSLAGSQGGESGNQGGSHHSL
ncbi:TPA: hypothetical protein ACH3X2_000642 [Trebouxia sp. C0005]